MIIFPGDIGLGQLVASDGNGLTDGSYFTISLAPSIGQASIDPVSGAWVYTSNTSFIGLDTFEVTVTDDDGFTSQQTISVTITAPNSHPVINIISPSNDHLFLTSSQSFLALANDLTPSDAGLRRSPLEVAIAPRPFPPSVTHRDGGEQRAAGLGTW